MNGLCARITGFTAGLLLGPTLARHAPNIQPDIEGSVARSALAMRGSMVS
jgi:hypothetical protein